MLIREGDQVRVISGGDRGVEAKVLKVLRNKNKVVVEGVNLVYKHVRPSQKNPGGGQLSKEMPIDASNVMVLEPSDNLPTRLGVRYREDGVKERFSKRTGNAMGELSPPRSSYAQ